MTPFLSIITRHMASRPRMFEECLRSLTAQTDQDFEHIVLVDHIGRGVPWANLQFARYRDAVGGDYVLILDDDDALATPLAVATLRAAVAGTQADIVIFRGDHCQLGILPDDAHWKQPPACGHISAQDLIVRREVWRRHVDAFGNEYAGDFSFIAALWRCGYQVHWLDAVLTRQQRISRGAAE